MSICEQLTAMTKFAVPSFVTQAAVDTGADSMATWPLTQVPLVKASGWNDFTVVAFETRGTAALVDASTSATIQARDHALGCQTCNPYTGQR